MANVPYNGGVPTVEPAARPPEDYQHIPTRPQEFGAELAQGEERLGEGATQAAKFYGQVTAQDSANKWEDETNKILYGDPNVIGPDGQPDRGYYGLRGQAALDAMPGVRQKIVDLRDQYASELSTPEQTFYFNQSTFRLNHFLMDEVGRHYDQNFTIYAGQANKATADLALTGIAQHANDDDFVAHATDRLTSAYVKNLQLSGAETNAEAVQDAHNRARADALEARIEALYPKDPARAQQLMESPDAALLKGPSFDALSGKLENAGDAAEAQRLVFGGATGLATGGGQNNPGNIRVPGSTGTGKEAFQSFRTPEEGYAAMAHQVEIYQDQHGLNTLAGIISRWSPPNENDTARLIKSGADASGLDPNQPINVHDPQTRLQVMTALAANEHGGLVPNPDALRAAANAPNVAMQLTQEPAIAQVVGEAGAGALQVPGLSQKLLEIQNSSANPRTKLQATRLAIETYNARYTDQERARTLREQQIKDASENRASQIVTDALSPNPTITVQQIGADPALTWQTKLHLTEALKKEGTPGQEAAAYGPGFWNAYQGVTAAPGDPSRITDMNQLLRRAGPNGDLTLAGVEKLSQALAATKKPEAHGDAKMQAGALAYAKHQLSFSADYGVYKIRDPHGEDAFNIGFTPAFFKYWGDGLAAGKSPAELVAKDQIDKLVAPFKRSPAEEMKDRLEAGTEAQLVGPTSGPPAAAIAFLKANPQLRGAFDQKYGANASNSVLGEPGPAPPIARP